MHFCFRDFHRFLTKNDLHVSWAAHVWIDASMGTTCAATLLWSPIALDAGNVKVPLNVLTLEWGGGESVRREMHNNCIPTPKHSTQSLPPILYSANRLSIRSRIIIVTSALPLACFSLSSTIFVAFWGHRTLSPGAFTSFPCACRPIPPVYFVNWMARLYCKTSSRKIIALSTLMPLILCVTSRICLKWALKFVPLALATTSGFSISALKGGVMDHT